MRNEAVLVGEHFGGDLRVIERAAGVGCGAGIFHSAGDEVIHHDLGVLLPGVVDAELLAEEIDHRGRATVVHGKTIATALRRVIRDRNAAPGVFHFIEFAGDDGDEVSRAWDRFAPGPSF